LVTEVRDGNAGPSAPLKNASLRMTGSLEGLLMTAFIAGTLETGHEELKR
jgi:hypothetical protein